MHRCLVCGRDLLYQARKDAKTCSQKCRQRLSRGTRGGLVFRRQKSDKCDTIRRIGTTEGHP